MPNHSPRRARLVAWGLLLVPLAAACGGDESSTGVSTAATTTTVATARPDFMAASVQVRAIDVKFPQTAFTADAGEISIGYVNDGNIAHTLAIETAAGEALDGWNELRVEDHGDVAIGTATFTPGDYLLFCTIAGHRAAGMEATLSVAG